jgi:protein involved in polysaccharide export with SLBB domain
MSIGSITNDNIQIVEEKVMSRGWFALVSLVVLLCLTAVNVSSQARKRTEPTEENEGKQPEDYQGVYTQVFAAVPLDGPIDPKRYLVGPSDEIAVSVWTVPPVTLTIPVNPEGTLLIPSVSEVRVAGETLSRTKELVQSAVKEKYAHADCSVTLVRPRPVVIRVTGNVPSPGAQTLTAADRVSKAVDLAFLYAREQLGLVSLRRIFIRHRDGTSQYADLYRFAATGDGLFNPYLREGDVIVVRERDPARGVFGVYGGVVLPGRFEFVEGDNLLLAIQLCYGLGPRAKSDTVEVLRSDPDGNIVSRVGACLTAIREGKEQDIPLEPGDRVIVHERFDDREDPRVTVMGEVRRPGQYPIGRGVTKLSEVIRVAGGFTPWASLGTSELRRRAVKPEQIQFERLESVRGGVSPQDSLYYRQETELRMQKEIVNVDFQALFEKGDSSQDAILSDGDVIQIRPQLRTVYVFGQVVSAGDVPFVKGEPVEYYLAKAGGVTERARASDIKIVKAKTRQWLGPGETEVEAGDYIWVPKEPDYTFGYYLNVIGQTATIVGVGVSLVLLVIQLNK